MNIINTNVKTSTADLYFDARKGVYESSISATEKAGGNIENSEVRAIASSNVDKAVTGIVSMAPQLTAPVVSADVIQLNTSIKSIAASNHELTGEQIHKALLNSVESQAKVLEQKKTGAIEITTLSASEIASATCTNILMGSTKPGIADSSAGESKIKANDVSSRQVTDNGVAPQTKADGGFNAQILANSRSQAMQENLDELMKAQQKNKIAASEMKVKSSQLAYQHGQNSATKLVEAGLDGRNQAITSGVTSLGFSAVGTGTQVAGATKSLKAQKNHVAPSNALKQKSAEIESQAATPSRFGAENDPGEAQVLSRSAMQKRNEAEQHDYEARVHTLQGDRLQAIGSAFQGFSFGAGQLTSSQFQAAQAEHQSASQMATTNQQVSNARSEAEEREAQNAQQITQQLLQQMEQVAQSNNSTASAILAKV